MLFILDKKLEVVDTLSNQGETSSITPFFEDEYIQYLSSGAETFSFQTLANTRESQHLTVGNYIAFRYDGKYKLFHITQIEEEHKEEFIKSVYCEMAGIELINDIVRPMNFSGNVKKFLMSILADTEWEVGFIDDAFTDIHDIKITEYTSAYSLLQEHIHETFNGELELTVNIKNNTVKSKKVNIYTQRGNDHGFRFAYTSNISSIKRTVDTSELCTALIGVGNNNVTFKEVEANDKPLNQDFIVSESAYKQWSRNGSHIMGVATFDTESPHELLRLTREELENRCQPKVKYELSTELITDDEVRIGDTVYVVDHEFNPPIYLQARISELKTSFTDRSRNECVLSNFTEVQSNITKQMKKIASKLEGYVDAQFPVGGDKISDGAISSNKIQSNAIQNNHIGPDSITTEKIKADTITTDKLKANSITTDKLQADSITAEKIKADSISADKIKADAITSDKIKADSITSDKIKADSITAEKIKADSINAEHLQADSVSADKIQANTINTGHLQSNSINADKIQSNSITSEKIIADAITSEKISADAVTSDKIQAGAITTIHLEADSITADKIQAGTITAEKIATGAIVAGSGIIANGAIGNAEISSLDASKIEAGTIDTSKVTVAGENGNLKIKGNRLQVFTGIGPEQYERVSLGDVNGDGTIYGLRVRGSDGQTILLDENGVTSEGITDGSITNDKISDNAGIAGSKLDIDTVVDRINEDGTKSIIGTKVQVGDSNLTVKLSSITETQTEQGESISQAYSKIEANEKAISLKVDSQTYTTDKASMTETISKHTSDISQLNSEIKLKVEATDITNAINGLETEINNKVSEITTDLNSITNRVSSVETTTKNLSENTTKIEERLSSAEQKITDEKIISTVSSTINTTVNTAINDLEIGGRNLYVVKNSSEGYLAYADDVNLGVMNNLRKEHTSEFIKVKQGETYIFQNWVTIESTSENLWMAYRLFDSNKVAVGERPAKTDSIILSNGMSYNFYKIVIPSGVSYLRVSARFYDDGKIKLEKGNKPTDWVLASEDVEIKIQETEEVLNNNIDNAVETATKDILDNVSQNYTNSEEFVSFQQTVNSQFEQTAENITATFKTVNEYTKEVDGKLQEYQDTVSTYIRFSDDGIDLGKSNSPFTSRLDNEKLAFCQDGEEVASISNNKMVITTADIDNQLRIGDSTNGFFVWTQGSNGNLTLKWSDK